jgi:hypothetical protein
MFAPVSVWAKRASANKDKHQTTECAIRDAKSSSLKAVVSVLGLACFVSRLLAQVEPPDPITLKESQRAQMDVLFFATPPTSRDSKREEQCDASVFILERKTYAESQICSATKPVAG